jgi:hypothetical protein
VAENQRLAKHSPSSNLFYCSLDQSQTRTEKQSQIQIETQIMTQAQTLEQTREELAEQMQMQTQTQTRPISPLQLTSRLFGAASSQQLLA